MIAKLRSMVLLFSLAALVTGKISHMPVPKEAIPVAKDACEAEVLKNYLLAYAWTEDNPEQASTFLATAEAGCPHVNSVLSRRIKTLRQRLGTAY